MIIEHRITANCPPEVIFDIYRDVTQWHTWDPDTRKAYLEPPFIVGSQGFIVPTQGRRVPMTLTAMDENRFFTVESRIPLFRMAFEHELHPEPENGPDAQGSCCTTIIHRVTLGGLLTLLIGKMMQRQLNTGLPVTLQSLKALAESRWAARATLPD